MSGLTRSEAIIVQLVHAGEAKESLRAALDLMHNAMAVTPLDTDVVGNMRATTQRIAGHLARHEELIALLRREARQADAEAERDG